MPDPVIDTDIEIFKAQFDANQLKLSEDVAKAKALAEQENLPTLEPAEEPVHVDGGVVAGENVVEQVDAQEKMLMENVAELRDLYAKTDYHERKAWNQVGVFFSGLVGKEMIETNNVAAVRGMYEKALNELKEYQIGRLKEKVGFSGGQLQDDVNGLLAYYNRIAPNELYDARTEVKIEDLQKSGKKWDKARVKMIEISDFYNKKVPLWAKLTFAGVALTAGSGAIIVSKRMLGAVIMSSTGGMQLDALARGKDAVMDAIESNRVAYNLSETGGVNFDLLQKTLDEKVLEVGDKMNTQIMRSYVNKAISLVGVSVLGYTAFNGLTSAFTPGVTKEGSSVVGGALEKVRTVQDHGAGSNFVEVQHPVPRMEKDIIKIATPDNVGGHAHHDSFIRSLKHHIAAHSGIDKVEAGHIAEVTFHDAAKEYAGEHKVGYDEAVKRLSNIHPGTTYEVTWDSNGHPHMHIDDEHVKFVKRFDHGNHSTGGHVVEQKLPESNPIAIPDEQANVAAAESLNNAEDPEFKTIETELQAEDNVDSLNAKITAENLRVEQDVSVADGFGKETFSADTYGHRDNLIDSKNQAMASITHESWEKLGSVSEVISQSHNSHQILHFSLEKITAGHGMGKSAYWNVIKNMKFDDALLEGGKLNESMRKLLIEFRGILKEKAMPIKDLSGNFETTRKWLARVTKLAIEARK